jgi:N-formylglutamate deformylase
MNEEAVFSLHPGHLPLLVSLPHVGTWIPPGQAHRYVERAFAFEDTDWHLERLYGFVCDLGASLLVPRASRYVIDLNRPPENTPMYPGANNTELCPTRFFTGDPLYRPGLAPDAEEVGRRLQAYWQPYHGALHGELHRLRARHGHAVLLDGHSIKSELPWLFEGRLWDLNLGTAEGHYGRPAEAVHAVQLEMCWSCYMQEAAPFAWDDARAAEVRPLLRALVQVLLAWPPLREAPPT